MSDHQTVVSAYADLQGHSELKVSEADAVARELNDIGQRADWEVVVIEEWLLDEKNVESVPGAYRVASGRVERETDKAILLSQGSDESWIPKSCSHSFVKRVSAELDIPQSGLGSFGVGSESDD